MFSRSNLRSAAQNLDFDNQCNALGLFARYRMRTWIWHESLKENGSETAYWQAPPLRQMHLWIQWRAEPWSSKSKGNLPTCKSISSKRFSRAPRKQCISRSTKQTPSDNWHPSQFQVNGMKSHPNHQILPKKLLTALWFRQAQYIGWQAAFSQVQIKTHCDACDQNDQISESNWKH